MTRDLPSKPLRVAKVAEILGINPNTVYEMCQERSIPAFKVGRLWLIPREEFIEWYESLKKRP